MEKDRCGNTRAGSGGGGRARRGREGCLRGKKQRTENWSFVKFYVAGWVARALWWGPPAAIRRVAEILPPKKRRGRGRALPGGRTRANQISPSRYKIALGISKKRTQNMPKYCNSHFITHQIKRTIFLVIKVSRICQTWQTNCYWIFLWTFFISSKVVFWGCKKNDFSWMLKK